MPTSPHLDERVNDRIAALLARVEGVKRGSDLHTRFDARGQREAQAIARADQERQNGSPK